MQIRKIKKEEFEKLQVLFPDSEKLWKKYREKKLKQFDTKEIDVFIIEENSEFIGEITVNYVSHDLLTETIPNVRVYLEAFRVNKNYQGKGLGQKLINYAIEDLSKKGYTEFTIGVEDDNEIAKHIYFKLGFTEAIDKGKGNEFDPSEYILYLKKINNKKEIEILVKKCKLGTSIIQIIPITGGLAHKMYKVVTDKENYAIKELNPNVMKRTEAYSNFVFSEKVAEIARDNGIPALVAIKVNGQILQKIEEKYFMIFPWIEGKILETGDITDKHVETISKTLANLYNIDFSEIEDESRKNINLKEFDWNKYIKKAEQENKKYSKLLKDNCNLLYELNKKANEATIYANDNLVISHRDLDRKNVMWQGENPIIIDWESSGYINPTVELIPMAYYWSGGDVQNIDYEKFNIFVKTFKKYYKGNIDSNIDILAYADFYSGLEWLEYNLQRALDINLKCEKDEITLAENQIVNSIKDIKYNVRQIENIIKCFCIK